MKQSIEQGFTGLVVTDEIIDRTEQMLKIHGAGTYLAGFEKALQVMFRTKSLEGNNEETLKLINSLSEEEQEVINRVIEKEREFLKG